MQPGDPVVIPLEEGEEVTGEVVLIPRAQAAVRQKREAGLADDVVVYLSGGSYFLEKTLHSFEQRRVRLGGIGLAEGVRGGQEREHEREGERRRQA